MLLATLFYAGSLIAQAISWGVSSRSRRAWELTAVVFFLAALFSHEAAATLPAVAWLMWREFHGSLWRRPVLVWGFTAALLLFAVLTVTANRNNVIFAESEYTVGAHAIEHALDYLVALYVGPGWWFSYTASVAAVVLLLFVAPTTRFGAGWLIAALLPYVWFTAGNVSRYHYLPSIGFGLAVAGAIVAGCSWLAQRFQRGSTFSILVYVVMVVFITVRFSRFDGASIRGTVQSMEPWRAYAAALSSTAVVSGDSIHVAPPDDDLVRPMYVQPLVQWIHRNYVADIVVEPRPAGQQ